MSPSTVPPGDGHVGVLADGDWTAAVSQSQNEMPPLTAGLREVDVRLGDGALRARSS